MRRHAERDNPIRHTVLIKLRRCVAAVAVKDEQAVGSLRIRLRTLIEILNPFIPQIICRPTVVADSDRPVGR